MAQQLVFPGFDLPTPPEHRLFFAVSPDHAAAERATQLAWALRDEHGLRRRPPACLHISLIGFRMKAPPPPEWVARMSEAAATLALASFAVEVDRVATFRGPPDKLPVVLLGDGAVAALTPLYLTLDERLRSFGFEYTTRSRFTPHLTVLYGERPVAPRAIPAIAWRVDELVLIHGHGRPYRHEVLGRWPLGGSSAQPGTGITSQSSGGRAAKARSVEPRTMPATSSGAVW